MLSHKQAYTGHKSAVHLAGVVAMLILTSAIAGEPTASSASNTAVGPSRGKTISDDVGFLFISIIAEITARPEVSAIDGYAVGNHWRRVPSVTAAMLNAKVAYAGKINGQVVMLGGDGTNDIFSVTIRDGFDPEPVKAMLRQVFTLKDEGSEVTVGQRFETYSLIDHSNNLGVVLISYGVAEAIRGTGTVGYMSARKVKEARQQ